MLGIEWFAVPCQAATLAYSLDAQFHGCIQSGEDHVIAFCLLFVNESCDSSESVIVNRDEAFADDVPFCCEGVKTQHHIISATFVAEGRAETATSSLVFAEHEQSTITIATAVPGFPLVESQCGSFAQVRYEGTNDRRLAGA